MIRRLVAGRLRATLWGLLALLSPGVAQGQADLEEANDLWNPTVAFDEDRVRLFPGGDLYGVYMADPHRPTNAVAVQFVTEVGIEGAKDVRTWLAGGARFGFVRLAPPQPGGRFWQLSVEAGLDALYDSKNKLDNVGYDGNYGLVVTTTTGGRFAFKLAALHTSSHVGDEWAKRTGRERLGYTREELAFGTAFRPKPGLRAYGELAVAYKRLNDDLQKPWRIQAGLERTSRRAFAAGRLGWYGALDLQSWQERDWRLDVSLEGGLMLRSAGRTVRLGLRYTNGRVPLGEFFQDTEAGISLGLWIDI